MADDDMEVRDHRHEDKMIGSSPMVIKLKFPKLTAAMEYEKSEEEDVIGSFSKLKEGETMNNQGNRVCPECKKEFSSGKALGGHMRVHVQANNKNRFLKPLKTTKFKKTGTHRDFNNGDENPNLKIADMKKEQLQQQKPYYTNCVNDDGEPTCSICGKTFPSMKSLFGHMRCHPEREWRGILPPPNTPTLAARRRNLVKKKPNSFASSTSSSLSENGLSNNEEGNNTVDDNHGDQVVDLTKFLRGWSVTERRGRKAVKPADEVVDDDGVLLEAVEDLMSLAHVDQSAAESGVTQRLFGVEVIEGSNSNSLTNKDLKINEKSPSINLLANAKGKTAMEEEIEGKPAKMEFNMIKNFSDNESDSRNTEQLLMNNNNKYKNPLNISPYKSPTKIKKRKKMKLMMELDQFTTVSAAHGGATTPPPLLPLTFLPEQPTDNKYKCTTCNKCFASHQALGGHRSSHNKSKFTSTDLHLTEPDDYESLLMNNSGKKEVEFAVEAMVALESNNNGGVHQCKICDKVFPTGQALGGHKRCHWTGTAGETQAPSSHITSTGEAVSQTGNGRRKGLDIDLNELPPTMAEEEGGNGYGNGNGYASSSYNSYIN